MTKKFFSFIFFITILSTNAQYYSLIDEWEAHIGYLNFQGDYGQRTDFSTTMASSGGLIGGKIYFNLLDPNASGSHFKFPLGFNTGYSVLSFDDAYNDYNSSSVEKIKAISGQVYFLNLSFSVEYHMADLRNVNFFSDNFMSKLDPYFGVGFGAMFYGVDVESDLGNYEKDPEILPDAFVGGIYSDPGIVPSVNLEIGVRYQISQEMQLSFNNKWMYFLSDKVDGLSPNPEMADNRYNDWIFAPSVGVVIIIF